MEKRCRRRFLSRDFIFLSAALLIGAAGLLYHFLGYSTPGALVEVTVDGRSVGRHPLAEPGRIPISADGRETNVLMIEGGKARMQWADCPDQICVHHAPIARDGEEIVCLPNRVVAVVVGSGEGKEELDAIAR